MAQQTNEWTSTFVACIEADDFAGAIRCLDEFKTGHAGTPPQAVKDRATTLIRQAFADDPAHILAVGITLTTSENAGAKEIGISLLPPFYETATEAINEHIVRVGNDANWEVREWAASALAHVIDRHFELVHPYLCQWAAHPSGNVRRMVVVAAGYAMREATNEQRQHLLDLLTPLLTDRDAYVSKNLGPFALGSYAIRADPDLVRRWAGTLDLRDEHSAWNLAMMLSTADAAKRIELFQDLLASLLRDHRTRVRRAVRTALTRLDKRNQPALTCMLQSWAASTDTQDIASSVHTTYPRH